MVSEVTTTLYWPQRLLHGVLTKHSRLTEDTDAVLWLVGVRAAPTTVCVVDITRDRSAVGDGLSIIGVCRADSQAQASRRDGSESALVTVQYKIANGDADATDRSLRLVPSGRAAQAPGVVVLYDPVLFTRGLAGRGVESMSPKSPLYAPLQQLQAHFRPRGALAAASRSANPLVTACEIAAYFSIGLPCAVINSLWQNTVLAVLSAPVLRNVPIGRGASIKDYSQCLTVFVHRLSNILTLPAHLRARYRREQNAATYTALSDLVVYLLLDYLIGLLFASFVTSTVLPAARQMGLHPLSFLDALRENVAWLMDAPAGFKLNDRLAAILGNGILMWLDFWEFLFNAAVTSDTWQAAVTTPVLPRAAILCWKHMGLTLQLSVFADALWLVTWNSYWVFLYFTKLNAMQMRLLSSLWKLFLGKKNNVLRKRVDSCEYDVNQLLLGTLLFTILVFLVTTNAVFFIFFGIVRFGVWISSAALWIPIVLLRGFPVVSVLHRLLKPSGYTATLSIETTYEENSLDSLTVQDISPSRRRARDVDDQKHVREYFQSQHMTATSALPVQAPIFFRVVARPSGTGQLFDRLQAYQSQLARSYNAKGIVNSCLFEAEIVPVDASVLFRTHLTKPTVSLTEELKAKQKVE